MCLLLSNNGAAVVVAGASAAAVEAEAALFVGELLFLWLFEMVDCQG